MNGARRAAAIWDDLTDRSGFCDDVDEETKREILRCWSEIIAPGGEGEE